jgi:hypothetical protein
MSFFLLPALFLAQVASLPMEPVEMFVAVLSALASYKGLDVGVGYATKRFAKQSSGDGQAEQLRPIVKAIERIAKMQEKTVSRWEAYDAKQAAILSAVERNHALQSKDLEAVLAGQERMERAITSKKEGC